MPDQQSFPDVLYELYLLSCERQGWNPKWGGVSAFATAAIVDESSIRRIFNKKNKREILEHPTIDKLLNNLCNVNTGEDGVQVSIFKDDAEKKQWGVRLHRAAYRVERRRFRIQVMPNLTDVPEDDEDEFEKTALEDYIEKGFWTFESIGWTLLARKLLGVERPIPLSRREVILLSHGATQPVEANSVVFGDVIIDGVTMYDDDVTTGLIVILAQAATITAPFGAVVTINVPDFTTALQHALFEKNKLLQELGFITREIDILIWPVDRPQRQKMKSR